MSLIQKGRSREAGPGKSLPAPTWERRDSINVLFVCNDNALAQEFGVFAKVKGLQVNYAWSLEGLDFLPLTRVSLAVVTGDRWKDHEIFGRPVSTLLRGFPRILVILEPGEYFPGGRKTQENVTYVQSLDELYGSINAILAHRRETENPADFLHH